MQPVYKVAVYAEDDATVLTPAAGAPHSEKFLVATAVGISDGLGTYQPILDFPQVDGGGRLDPIETTIETGSRTYRVLDQRYPTPGQGATTIRFASAYFGDAQGLERWKGLKIVEWTSWDNGLSFGSGPTFTGRITADAQDGNVDTFTAKDTSDELNAADLFGGAPHADIDFVARESLWPPGLTRDYGPFKAVRPFTARMSGPVAVVSATNMALLDNFVSSTLVGLLRGGGALGGHPFDYAFGLRALVKQTSGGSSGTIADYNVPSLTLTARGDSHWAIASVTLEALPGGTAIPATTVNIEIHLYADKGRLFIGDVHRVTLMRYILEGKFGRLNNDGSVVRTYPFAAAEFATFEADDSWGTVRFPGIEKAKLSDWVKEQLRKPAGLGYDLNGDGEITPIDLRMPGSLAGLVTLANDDFADVPTWASASATVPGVLQHTYYGEALELLPDLPRDDAEFPDVSPGRILVHEIVYLLPNAARPALGDRKISIQGMGERFTDAEITNGQARRDWIERRIQERLHDLLSEFAAGAQEASGALTRTAAAGLTKGQWVLVEHTALPDPATNERGGTRLMQILELRPDGTRVSVGLLDAGVSVAASVPTIGTLALESGNELHGIVVPVTLNADDQAVRIRVAVTATSAGSAPADDDPLWVFGAKATADGDQTIRPFPSDRRVWVQGRSEPNDGFQLPSAWATNGSGYVDTDPVDPPTSLAASVSGRKVRLTWSVGDATLPVEVLYCTPSGGTPALVITLPPGAEVWDMGIIDASTSHKAQVRHPDGYGGSSDVDEETFNTTTGGFTIPGPPGVQVLIGRAP